MRKYSSLLLLIVASLFISACGHLDIQPQPQGDRVLTGTVNFRADAPLPDNAVAVVRLLDITQADQPPQVIAVQTIQRATSSPLAFSLECKVEDLLPPKHVRIEARISVGGKLRYASINAVPITASRVDHPFEIWIESVNH
jgi:uncharacterized lipoprotein YbaY